MPSQSQISKWLELVDELAFHPVQGHPLRLFLPFDAFLESWLHKKPMAQTERIKREAITVPSRQEAEQA